MMAIVLRSVLVFSLLFELCMGQVNSVSTHQVVTETVNLSTKSDSHKIPKTNTVIDTSEVEKFLLALENVKTKNCKRDLNATLSGFLESQQWAIAMYDSTVKAPVGIEIGSVYQFGNFDECINSSSSNEITTITDDEHQRHYPRVMPKYCLADVTVEGLSIRSIASRKYQQTNRTTVHWAICTPRSCTPNDVEIFMKSLLQYKTRVTEQSCYYPDEVHVTNGMIIYSSIVFCFILMAVFSTIYDMYLITRHPINKLRSKGCLEMIVKSFSIIENLKKLIQTSNDQMGLNAINGIKAISMLCIICGHALLFIIGGPVMNSDFFAHDIKLVQNGFLLNSPLFVDTFLLLSGFLFCRILLKELEVRDGRLNVLILYVGRYIRLTPAYLAVITFYMTWLPYIGSGPLWKQRMEIEQERCQKSWWLNILYVNNYFGTENLCMFQSWYLSADTQLFILAPAVIFLLWKKRRMGVYLLSGSVVVTTVLPFIITYCLDLDPTLLGFADEVTDISTNQYFVETYMKTHMRATAYVFGLLTGFLVHYIQEKQIILPKPIVIGLWIFSLIVGLASMFSISIFFLGPFSTIESALYAGLHRVGWSIFTGWMVLSVTTDNARILKNILSSRFFVPLSRLTYCAYLSNGLIELYHLGTLRSPVYMSRIRLLGDVTAHNCLTFLLALILCLLFESPIHGIEKIFLQCDRQRRHAEAKDEQTPSTSDASA